MTNQSDSYFSSLSGDCNTALTAPLLDCPAQILTMLGSNAYYTIGDDAIMDVFCNATCPSQLADYRTSVVSACGTEVQPIAGFPSTYWVDAATSVFTMACMQDSASGQYCSDFFNETLGNAADATGLLGGYDTAQLCSECVINMFAHQQSTPYSNYDADSASAWAAIQASCSLSTVYPTATQTLVTNVTNANYAPAGYATASCVSGLTYDVVSGDNCEAIAEANSVSTGGLIALNSIRIDCTNIYVGQTLCLPQPCTSYVVQDGDSCVAIANATGTSFQQLVSWNPTIDAYCTNLISGQNICVGPPGGYGNFSTIAGATVTQTAQYATTTAARPTPVASGTTQSCGKYYQVESVSYRVCAV